MKYYNIKDKRHRVPFYQAVTNGLAPNNGLYFPESIPKFSETFFHELKEMSLQEIALHVLFPYVSEDISITTLKQIVKNVFDFEIPLHKVEENLYSLELFHGPTLAFKDIGARFLANTIQHLNKEKQIRVLVATSGDTGSAVANGFYNIEGTEVVILYPKGKVSELQQKQFTTLGKNIKPIAIDGTFDDCQRLVKSAFSDVSLNEMNLTSANSINIARWIPQSVYYYWAVAQLPLSIKNVVVSVPSGNLGNLTAGLLAKKSGLNIQKFVVASNTNNTVPYFLEHGEYIPIQTIQTIANAMDVGDPNNFPRLLELFNNDVELIRSQITGKSYSDDEIKETITSCYKINNYLLDPHGATAYASIKSTINSQNEVGIFLETAHPGKFYTDVCNIIEQDFELPDKLVEFSKRESKFNELSSNYEDFRDYLTQTYQLV